MRPSTLFIMYAHNYWLDHLNCYSEFCDDPLPPINGFLGDHSIIRVGKNVSYQCNNRFRPSAVMATTCTSDLLWIPAPEKHNCTLVTGMYYYVQLFLITNSFLLAALSLTLLSPDRVGIDCLGDTIVYNCSILSNSENVNLVWRVTFLGMTPVNIMYDGTSNLNTSNNFDMGVSSTLTEYSSDEYIESIVVMTVLINVDIILQCSIEELRSRIIVIDIDSSGM